MVLLHGCYNNHSIIIYVISHGEIVRLKHLFWKIYIIFMCYCTHFCITQDKGIDDTVVRNAPFAFRYESCDLFKSET